jgi:hypothetical protein
LLLLTDAVGDNGDLDSDNDGIPDNAKEAIAPGDGQQDRAKKVAKFKAGKAVSGGERFTAMPANDFGRAEVFAVTPLRKREIERNTCRIL